jgi:hypothetical protein
MSLATHRCAINSINNVANVGASNNGCHNRFVSNQQAANVAQPLLRVNGQKHTQHVSAAITGAVNRAIINKKAISYKHVGNGRCAITVPAPLQITAAQYAAPAL